MPLSDSFREFADETPDYLSIELGKEMQAKGFMFLEFGGFDDVSVPRPSSEALIDALGGEENIDADFDGLDKFTVTHKETGISVTSNGAIDALAKLWLEVNA